MCHVTIQTFNFKVILIRLITNIKEKILSEHTNLLLLDGTRILLLNILNENLSLSACRPSGKTSDGFAEKQTRELKQHW